MHQARNRRRTKVPHTPLLILIAGASKGDPVAASTLGVKIPQFVASAVAGLSCFFVLPVPPRQVAVIGMASPIISNCICCDYFGEFPFRG